MNEKDLDTAIEKCERIMEFDTRTLKNPESAQPCIRVHSAWHDGEKVELEIDGKRHTVIADELVSAINKAKLNVFGI